MKGVIQIGISITRAQGVSWTNVETKAPNISSCKALNGWGCLIEPLAI